MNFKLLKGAHLSDRKFREILELFCDDLTATQAASITGVSRVTINNYFKVIRILIASHIELNSHDESVLNGLMPGDTVPSRENPDSLYGLSYHRGKILSFPLHRNHYTILVDRNQRLYSNHVGDIMSVQPAFHAIANYRSWQLQWLMNDKSDALVNHLLAGVSDFWHLTKRRLQKFRGMRKSTLYLHIKECEFRYNFRNEDILHVLTGILSGKNTSNTKSS